MIDDTVLGRDPELRRRWGVIRRKLEENSEALLMQGGLVPKRTSSGRRAWAVRWVDRSGQSAVHHSIYLGDDERLVELVRRRLAHYRMLGRLAEDVADHARFAASASFAVRRLAAGRRGGRPRA